MKDAFKFLWGAFYLFLLQLMLKFPNEPYMIFVTILFTGSTAAITYFIVSYIQKHWND